MNIFKKILLYFSAFIPLYLLLLIKIAIELINGNISINILNTIMISFLCLFASFGLVGILLCMNSGKKTQIVIKNAINITEKHFLGYFSLFVLFALTFQIELVCMAVVFLLVLVMIGVVYVKNNLFYINPLLNIVGYSFYSVEYTTTNSTKTQTGVFLFYGKLKVGQTLFATITDYNFNIIKK